MIPGHPPPSAVNVFFYAQQNPIIRVKTAKPCQKSEIGIDIFRFEKPHIAEIMPHVLSALV